MKFTLLVAVFAMAMPAFAQTSSFGAARTVAAGTGTIRGRVTSTDGIPGRQADVQLTVVDGGRAQKTTADAAGYFAFDAVAPGRYSLRASKSGFLPFAYGQRSWDGRPETITIGAGEALNGLEIALPRPGAISGRITNEYGEPVLGAAVSALKYGYTATGQRTLNVSPSFVLEIDRGGMVHGMNNGAHALSDDLGQFRLFGLAPGEYVVTAMPLAERSGPAAVFAPTFYPGTSNATEAVALRIGLAEESTIQLQLVPGRSATVSGTVVDSRGRPAAYGLPVSLRPLSPMGQVVPRMGNMHDGGEFSIDGVPPGDYTLTVAPFPNLDSYPKLPGGPEYAALAVSVTGSDITNLHLTTRPPTTLTGRIEFEGKPPESLRGIELQAVNAERNFSARFGPAPSDVRNDATIRIPDITGPITLDVNAGSAYVVKAITVGGVDVTGLPFDPTAYGATVEARIVLTDKVTVIAGTLPKDRVDSSRAVILIVADTIPPARRSRATPGSCSPARTATSKSVGCRQVATRPLSSTASAAARSSKTRSGTASASRDAVFR
jgi:hypothetical protein